MSESEEQHRDVAAVSVILFCFASGASDVLSYLTLGSIFTSAMTGAAALLFITLVNGHFPQAIRAAVALLSYMAGSALATFLQPRDLGQISEVPTLRLLVIAEGLLLGAYCILSALARQPPEGGVRYGLIALSALAMGVQSVVARDIKEPGISSVVINMTLTSIMAAATRILLRRGLDHLPRENKVQIIAMAVYALGAAGAAASLLTHAVNADLLPLGAVVCVLGLDRYRVYFGRG